MAVAEGRQFQFEGEEKILTNVLETFAFVGRQKIHIRTDEFSAVCPFSGLPDIATIKIDYIPKGKCLELKSFKYYLVSFRNVGIYQEAVTERIFEDLKNALNFPDELRVETEYNTRGGIDVTCVKEY